MIEILWNSTQFLKINVGGGKRLLYACACFYLFGSYYKNDKQTKNTQAY
jgi:hypothetical protein